MPVPFHAAAHTSRSLEPSSERARLEQGALRAFADEQRQRRDERRASKRHSQQKASWSIAALRLTCAAGLLLVALTAVATKALAGPESWPQVTVAAGPELRSGGGQIVALTVTPGSGHHYTGHQIEPQALPGSGHHYTGHQTQPQAVPGSGHHYTGHQRPQTSPIQPLAVAVRPRETFHWADAGVGAGCALVLSALVAGGVLAIGRRSASRRHIAA